jgi:hypothetical protein
MMKVDAFATLSDSALRDGGGAHPDISMSVADLADQVKRLPPSHFDKWVATAQPGSRVIYGIGLDAPSAAGAGVARRMMKLHDAGLVRLHLVRARRDGSYPIDFIAVRRAKPVPKGFPELPREPYSGAGRTTNVAGK